MIERQHLRIVAAIAEKGTLTQAAESLHLTQSALSHAMKKLEQQFDLTLWDKDGRRLRLTQAGQAMLNLAQRVLPQFESMEAQFADFAEGLQGNLRIGMECHPCYQWLLKVVKPFLQDYPKVDVDVRQAFQFGGLQALRGHEIDLLLTPDPLHINTVTYEPVFEYQQVLVMAKDHPLSKKPWIAPQDLSNETLITYPVEPSRLDVFAQFLTPAGAGVRKHKTIETTEILLQMVSAGRGVSALPHWMVKESHQDLNLHWAPLGKQGLAKRLYLGYRSQDVQPEYLKAFLVLAKNIGGQSSAASS